MEGKKRGRKKGTVAASANPILAFSKALREYGRKGRGEEGGSEKRKKKKGRMALNHATHRTIVPSSPISKLHERS